MTRLIFLLAILVSSILSQKICKEPGLLVGSNPSEFICCVEKDGELHTVINKCSDGLVFDISRKTCTVPRVNILLSVGDGTTTTPTALSSTTSHTTTALLTPKQPCKGPGAYCSTCDNLSFCVSLGQTETGTPILQNILDLECGSGSVCVTGQGCVRTSAGGLCRQGPFICSDVGLYPDLYDCTKYHRCYSSRYGDLLDQEESCSGGLLGNRWNPEANSCGWPEDTKTCSGSPVPFCNTNLQMGPAGGSVYYICMVNEINHTLSPRLFLCPQGRRFNETSYSCN